MSSRTTFMYQGKQKNKIVKGSIAYQEREFDKTKRIIEALRAFRNNLSTEDYLLQTDKSNIGFVKAQLTKTANTLQETAARNLRRIELQKRAKK